MKICLVNTFYSPIIIGGAEISVQKLAEGIKARGIDVFVISTGEEDHIEYINGIKVYRMKVQNIHSPLAQRNCSKYKKYIFRVIDIYNSFNSHKICNILKKESPHIIHTNNIYGMSPVIWKNAKKLNIKIVQTLRDYHLLCPKTTLLNRLNEVCISENFICKIYRKINKKDSSLVDIVTAPSKFTLDIFKENGYFKGVKSKYIYNAIDVDNNKLNCIYKYRKNKKMNEINFIFIGALDKHKGIDILLESFYKNKNSDIRLHIAGKGNLEELVKNYVEIDNRIVYHGFLNENEKEELILNCDVMVVPSVWYEPFGRVVIEAYKYGLPVIVTNMGGLPEIVEDEKTGFIIKEKLTIDEMSKALDYYINNKKIIGNMLPSCKLILEKFELKLQIDNFVKIYNDLI